MLRSVSNFWRYLRTFICISRVIEGGWGFGYVLFAELRAAFNLDLLKEIFVNDWCFFGVSIFLNFDKYKSLYPLSVWKWSSGSFTCINYVYFNELCSIVLIILFPFRFYLLTGSWIEEKLLVNSDLIILFDCAFEGVFF